MERKRAVAGIVEKDGKILLGKKSAYPKSTLSGEWHPPGETVEGEESDQETLIRGVREEAGIEVEIIKFVGSHETPKGNLVNWYLCRTSDVDLVVGSDLEEVRWVPLNEVLELSGETEKMMWPEEVRQIFARAGE
jgi:ADP-ribose pyrophosphatase YjhB (NUDIX family)